MCAEFTCLLNNETAQVNTAEYNIPIRHDFVTTIGKMVAAVMRGEAFLALTGPAGSGKTTAAAAIRNELASRSVNVLLVHRGPDNTLRLRDIVSQVLGKPDTALNDDDIEKLFDVMTVRETPDRRVVLIIDDAELLQTSAMEYLHLLSSLVTTVAAQFIFVGRPEFWDNANHGATVQFKDLITARWELGPSSPDEILRFIEQTLSSRGLSVRETFDDDGLDALVRHSDGLFGRVLSLLSIAGNVQRQRHEIRLNPSAIDEAARRLAAGAVAQTDWDVPSARIEADNSTAAEDANNSAAAEDSAAVEPPLAAEALPAPDVEPETTVSTNTVTRGPTRRRQFSYAIGSVALLIAAGAVTYWQVSVAAHRHGESALNAIRATIADVVPLATNTAATSRSDEDHANAMLANSDTSAAARPPAQPPSSPTASAAATNSPAAPLEPQSHLAEAQQDKPVAAAASQGAAVANTSPARLPQTGPAVVPAATENGASQPTSHALQPTNNAAQSANNAAQPTNNASETTSAAALSQANAAGEQPGVVQPNKPGSAAAPASLVVANTAPAPPPQPASTPDAAPGNASADAHMSQEPSPPAILPTAASPVQQRVIAASQPAGGAAAHPNNDVALPSSPTATAGDLQPSARSPQLKQAAAIPAPAAVSSAAVAPRGNTAATPAIAQPSPAVARELSVLLARGDAMLALGDVVTARLFYQRAATLGSARAAMAAGKTYDSAFLASIDATGIIPDRAAADFWYRKGAALGYRATGGLADMAGAPGDR